MNRLYQIKCLLSSDEASEIGELRKFPQVQITYTNFLQKYKFPIDKRENMCYNVIIDSEGVINSYF